MSKSFLFHIGNQKITKQLSFNQLNKFPENIRDLLHQNSIYTVKSNVNPEHFNNFIDSFLDENLILQVNIDNIYYYRLLSEEFNIMTEYLSKDKFQDLYELSILLNSTNNENNDKSTIENLISQNLDYYLYKHFQNMYKISITSLYNIFNNKNRVLNNHDKAYQFLTSEKSDEQLFLLIGTLDGTKMSESTLRESISKQKEHQNFIPKNSMNRFFDEQEKNKQLINDLKEEIKKLNSSLCSLKIENESLKKKNENEVREINKQLCINFNSLPLKLQKNMITESINNSSNIKEFFQKLNVLFDYLSKLHLQDVEHFFNIQMYNSENEEKFSILIHHDVTEFLHNNKLLKSEELKSLISGFDKVYFEVRYPHDQFNSICNNLSEIFLYVTKLDGIRNIIKTKEKIKGVKLDSSIDKIYEKAFSDLSSTIQILIPPTVNFIEKYAFKNCTSLVQISIPPSVKKIEDYTFANCISLVQVSIPSSVEVIDAYAFRNCTSLAQISIPSSVKRIEGFAFEKCKSLTQIKIPSSVTSIGCYIFNECSSIVQLSISSSITRLRSLSFAKCSSLKEIIIPPSVTEIEECTFFGCTSLMTITIPLSVTEIAQGTFYECTSLMTITIPSSVTFLGRYAFYKCTSLTEIIINSQLTEIKPFTFSKCESLVNVILPQSLEKIGISAFSECISLVKIEIPPSVNQIEPSAFAGCSHLSTVAINLSEVKIASTAFDGCNLLEKEPFSPFIYYIPPITKIDDFTDHTYLDDINNGIRIYESIHKNTNKKVLQYVYAIDVYDDWEEFVSYIQMNCIDIPELVKIKYFYYPSILNIDNQNINGFTIVTDFMTNGIIAKPRQKLSPTALSKIIFGVACIMKKLHQKNIPHCNLVNWNIYLDDNLEPKIGLVYNPLNYFDDCIQPPHFHDMSVNNNKFASDIFAYGILLSSILLNERLGYKYKEKISKSKKIPDYYREIINKCLDENIKNRLSFDEITEILRDDKYALQINGIRTDLDELHEYQDRIDI